MKQRQVLKSVFFKLLVGAWLILMAIPANASQLFQNSFVTINVKNVTVKEFLTQVQRLTKLDIVYMSSDLSENETITYSCNKKNVSDVLNETLKSFNLNYKVENQTIVVYKDVAVANKTTASVVAQQPTQFEISGKIVDDEHKPVLGATILIKGDTLGRGALTDEKGNFKLKVSAGNILEISYLGFEPIEYKVEATKTKDIIIVMKKSLQDIGNVVITGIFNKAKESYTGSVSTITAKEMRQFKGQNLLTTLRNVDPSLNIVQDNMAGSNPNRLPEVNIRGNSSLPGSLKEIDEGAKAQLNAPLVVMDGFEVSLQRLMDFNDEDIEQINILKDASATAIYGSRGANGVIVIVTKAPQAGKLRVFAQIGLNLEVPDLSSYDLLNAKEKFEFERNIGLYTRDEYGNTWANRDIKRVSDQYNSIYRDVLSGVDTYWLSQPLRTGVGQKYNTRIEGGSQEFRWSISLGYNQNIGVMKNSDRNTFDGTVNLSYTYKNLLFKNQTSVSTSKGNDSNYGSFSDYTKMNPYWRIHDEDGKLIKEYVNHAMSSVSVNTSNPLYNAQYTQINTNNNTDLTNNFSIEWKVSDDFTAKGRFGFSKNFNSRDRFRYAQDNEFNKYSEDDYLRRGSYNYTTGEGLNYDGSITLNYVKNINEKHQIYAGIDGSLSQKSNYWYKFDMQGFHDEYFNFLANAGYYMKDGKPSGDESVSRLASLVANVNYTYLNRYYLDFAYRYDGSSQFGAKNKFAPFWSAGIGWSLHQEDFLKDSKIIDRLRLKASYGVTGSQQFDSYKAIATYQYNVLDRYMSWNSASLMGLGNENLKWQSTNQANIGFEISLLENRLSASFDVYNKITDNLLSEMNIPLATGFSSYTENVGKVKNEGFEAMLSGYLIRNLNREFAWTVTGKIGHNKNTISKLSEAIKQQTRDALNDNTDREYLLYEGDSQSSLYAVRSLGIDPSTGVEMYLDKYGIPTYNWNPNAKIYTGLSEPKYRGNFSTMLMYKDFTLNLSFGYHWGGQQINSTIASRIEISRNGAFYNVDRRASEERWMKPGDITAYKGYYERDGKIAGPSRLSTRFIENDNMFSLQSASLQYNWRAKWVKENLKMDYVNFSLNASDIFYISTIKRERGLDYPFARRVSLAIALTF